MKEKMYKILDKYFEFVEKVKEIMVKCHMAKWVEDDFEALQK